MADPIPPATPPRSPDDLAGALVARPGQPLPTLHSTRREWAPVLAPGRSAAALPGLLSAVYALCGGAHRWTAAAAVAAAQGQAVVPTGADRAALRADTLREHLRRLALDWPRALPEAGVAADAAVLAGCPLMQDPGAVEASRGWIDHTLLGRPAAAWWADWQQGGETFVRDWARGTETPVARWLRAADAVLDGLAVPCDPLCRPARSDPAALGAAAPPAAALRVLAERLRGEPGYALAPDWFGVPRETGPWTRLADTAPPQGQQPAGPSSPSRPATVEPAPAGAAIAASPATLPGSHASPTARLGAFHRLAARLAEVAALVADGGERRLALGALAVAPGDGLAWCEMARGLLVHWVQLRPAPGADGQAVVERCRVLAPTEWNFHPHGALAQALSALPPDVPEAMVRVLAAAFDPCVALTIARPAAAPAASTGTEAPNAAPEETRCTR